MKITAIHGGGDWNDASAEYLVVPEGIDVEDENRKRAKWYRNEYLLSLRNGEKPQFIDLVAWLEKLGAREPTGNELEIVDDDMM